MGTTWGPSEGYGDNVEMMGMTGTTQGRWERHGDHGDNMWRPRRPHTMGTTWGPSEGYGDNVGMTRLMRG